MKPCLAVLALLAVSPFASAFDLGPGSPAPALSIKSWIKGKPVNRLEKDKLYVVEFWATWCGPCIQSIPHLTEVAHKNPDVTFIGVSVWEDQKDGNIEKFVDDMGPKMDYHVAYSGNQEGMAQTWMKAAYQNGIPTAFIVKNGNVQWIGHPMEIEKPLAQVKAGTFDMADFKRKFAVAVSRNKKQMAIQVAFEDAMTTFQAGSHPLAKDKLNAIVAKHPEVKQQAETVRFRWLAVEDPEAWAKKADGLAASKDPNDIQTLRGFALSQAEQKDANVKLAEKAIDLALTASGSDNVTLQYAILVFQGVKDNTRALDCTNKLLSSIGDDAQYAELRKSMEKKKVDIEAAMKASHQ